MTVPGEIGGGELRWVSDIPRLFLAHPRWSRRAVAWELASEGLIKGVMIRDSSAT